MLEQIAIAALTFGATTAGYLMGAITEHRRNRRQNGATAQCAACNWESDRLPLSEAFNAAAAHTATPAHTDTERHRGFVVKA